MAYELLSPVRERRVARITGRLSDGSDRVIQEVTEFYATVRRADGTIVEVVSLTPPSAAELIALSQAGTTPLAAATALAAIEEYGTWAGRLQAMLAHIAHEEALLTADDPDKLGPYDPPGPAGPFTAAQQLAGLRQRLVPLRAKVRETARAVFEATS